jgi:hypothetical protein
MHKNKDINSHTLKKKYMFKNNKNSWKLKTTIIVVVVMFIHSLMIFDLIFRHNLNIQDLTLLELCRLISVDIYKTRFTNLYVVGFIIPGIWYIFNSFFFNTIWYIFYNIIDYKRGTGLLFLRIFQFLILLLFCIGLTIFFFNHCLEIGVGFTNFFCNPSHTPLCSFLNINDILFIAENNILYCSFFILNLLYATVSYLSFTYLTAILFLDTTIIIIYFGFFVIWRLILFIYVWFKNIP